jgi:AbiV family abortive infection protein
MAKKKRVDDAALAADLLLLGALYALEQCGLLLIDAAALLEQRRYPTSAAIALLAHEELGRHRILLDLWRRSVGGTRVTRETVTKACDDHVEKQRSGQLSLTRRMEKGDQLQLLLRARRDSPPGSAERQAAQEQIHLLDERQMRRQPTDRHQKRMRAVYVDLLNGDAWSRPCDLDPQDCADEVQNAINDYTNARLRCIEEAATIHGDHQLAEAVAALMQRPTFPPTPQLSIEAMLPPSHAHARKE